MSDGKKKANNYDEKYNNFPKQEKQKLLKENVLPEKELSEKESEFNTAEILSLLEEEDINSQRFLSEYSKRQITNQDNAKLFNKVLEILKDNIDKISNDILKAIFERLTYHEEAVLDVNKNDNLKTLMELFKQKSEVFPKNAIECILISLIKDKDFSEEGFTLFYDSYDRQPEDINKLLHTILRLGNTAALHTILDRGVFLAHPYLTYKGRIKYLIDEMHHSTIADFLDSCITISEASKTAENFEIYFDYKNFISPFTPTRELNEMTPIKRLIKNEETIKLLNHPLIRSFMTMKWRCISKIFVLQFVLYCLHAVCMVGLIIANIERYHPKVIDTFWYCSIVGVAHLIIRELIQLSMDPRDYLRNLNNYWEIVLIVLSIKTLQMDFQDDESRFYVVVLVLLMAWELVFLIGYFPITSVSTHILMLKEVLKSFLKSFILYSIFVFTFVLCFRVLLQSQTQQEQKKVESVKFGNETEVINEEQPKPKFGNTFEAFVKTIAMIAGELDFENLGLNNIYSYILILVFIISMTLVLTNLLSGLAVSDIQAIKQQAELNVLICRANLLIKHGKTIFHMKPQEGPMYKNSSCFCNYKLAVEPNNSNSVNPATCKHCKENSNDKIENNFPLFPTLIKIVKDFFFSIHRPMESETVSLAWKSIDNNTKPETDAEKVESRLRDIENHIVSMNNYFKAIQSKGTDNCVIKNGNMEINKISTETTSPPTQFEFKNENVEISEIGNVSTESPSREMTLPAPLSPTQFEFKIDIY